MLQNQKTSQIQQVRWSVPDGLAPGIRVWRAGQDSERLDEEFIPWDLLKEELERVLLPQALAQSTGYTVRTAEYNGKKDWLVQIVDPAGQPYCEVWFGGNPDKAWIFDGSVRIGDSKEPPYAWQAYHRYTDGTYVCYWSRSGTIDELARR